MTKFPTIKAFIGALWSEASNVLLVNTSLFNYYSVSFVEEPVHFFHSFGSFFWFLICLVGINNVGKMGVR